MYMLREDKATDRALIVTESSGKQGAGFKARFQQQKPDICASHAAKPTSLRDHRRVAAVLVPKLARWVDCKDCNLSKDWKFSASAHAGPANSNTVGHKWQL